jgi:hypothetical protein
VRIPVFTNHPGRLTPALALLLFAGPTTTTACGGNDATAPDVCSIVSLSRSGNLGIDFPCGALDVTISGVQYDQFGRPIAYTFDHRCTAGGSGHYSGSVTNIRWNDLGEALGATVRINGTTCNL